jgi:acetyl esterase/lipase
MLKHTFLLAAFLGLAVVLPGQDLVRRQFAVRWTNDQVYGVAARFDGVTDTLRMNIAEPVDDGVRRRPMVVWIHGGAFLQGSRTEMRDLCERWAARGYVAMTVSYRLGFTAPPLQPAPYAYDEAEVLRAAYRATIDVRTAIAWVIAQRSTLLRLDTSHIVVGGTSAGGITALLVAYMDDDERPDATRAIGATQVLLDKRERPDMGPAPAKPHIAAVVNYFGALTDTSMIDDAADVPVFSYHQEDDPVVSSDARRGLWGLPLGVGDHYPVLYGTKRIARRAATCGYPSDHIETIVYPGAAHELHNTALVDSMAAVFVARLLVPTTSVHADAAPVSFDIAPHPVVDLCELSLSVDADRARIYNTNGTLALEARVNEHSIDCSRLLPGIYVIELNGHLRSFVKQ